MSKEEAKYKKYETPQESPTWEQSATRAATPYQALMETSPHEEPDLSIAELLELREVLVDAFDQLTEEEAWVLNSLIIERMSIRELSKQISAPKTTIARIRDRALKRLREMLQDNEIIIQALGESEL